MIGHWSNYMSLRRAFLLYSRLCCCNDFQLFPCPSLLLWQPIEKGMLYTCIIYIDVVIFRDIYGFANTQRAILNAYILLIKQNKIDIILWSERNIYKKNIHTIIEVFVCFLFYEGGYMRVWCVCTVCVCRCVCV